MPAGPLNLFVRQKEIKMTRLVFGVFVVAILLFSSNVIYAQWYQGGTLHRASIAEWMAASYENRLATAADFVVSISKKENPQILSGAGSVFLTKLKLHASELEKCISQVGAEPKASRGMSVAEVGSLCYITMYKSR